MAIGSILACIVIGGTAVYVAVVIVISNIPPADGKPKTWKELEDLQRKERRSGNYVPPVKKSSSIRRSHRNIKR